MSYQEMVVMAQREDRKSALNDHYQALPQSVKKELEDKYAALMAPGDISSTKALQFMLGTCTTDEEMQIVMALAGKMLMPQSSELGANISLNLKQLRK